MLTLFSFLITAIATFLLLLDTRKTISTGRKRQTADLRILIEERRRRTKFLETRVDSIRSKVKALQTDVDELQYRQLDSVLERSEVFVKKSPSELGVDDIENWVDMHIPSMYRLLEANSSAFDENRSEASDLVDIFRVKIQSVKQID